MANPIFPHASLTPLECCIPNNGFQGNTLHCASSYPLCSFPRQSSLVFPQWKLCLCSPPPGSWEQDWNLGFFKLPFQCPSSLFRICPPTILPGNSQSPINPYSNVTSSVKLSLIFKAVLPSFLHTPIALFRTPIVLLIYCISTFCFLFISLQGIHWGQNIVFFILVCMVPSKSRCVSWITRLIKSLIPKM